MSQNVQQAERKESAAREIFEIIKTVVYALVIALVLRIFLFQPFTIPSASMEPNLYQGDYIIVSKFTYGYSRHSVPFSPPIFKGRIFGQPARRGDIAVFKLPSDGHTDYVKRVIGVGGDQVQMRDSQLYVNGALVERALLSPAKGDIGGGLTRDLPRYQETLAGGRTFITQDESPDSRFDNTGVYVVPQGYYFVMGDNRDNSADSRVSPAENGVGLVPEENLVGRAQIILLSWKPAASLFLPWTWISEARPSRFFKVLK